MFFYAPPLWCVLSFCLPLRYIKLYKVLHSITYWACLRFIILSAIVRGFLVSWPVGTFDTVIKVQKCFASSKPFVTFCYVVTIDSFN